MSRQKIGDPHLFGAQCPQCGETLVLVHWRRTEGADGRLYRCPKASLDFYRLYRGGGQGVVERRPGHDTHSRDWLFTPQDCEALLEGRPQDTSLARFEAHLAHLQAAYAARTAGESGRSA